MKRLYTAPAPSLRRWFWILLLLNILYMAGSRWYLQPFTSNDIVRFEVARQVAVAQAILQNWKLTGKLDTALQSIYIDFLFIILYTAGLSIACVFSARLTQHEILVRTGKFFSYLVPVAGICDVIENIAMMRSLQNTVSSWNVLLAYDMAATKFSILILSLLFIVICLVFWALRKVAL